MFRGDDDGRGSDVDSRGQTTLDFAIGISIFLTVVMFVFAFIPGMLAPFTDATVEETAAVDRTANHVSQNVLGHPTEPYVLDLECTDRFFEGLSPGSNCRYDDGSSLTERTGASDRGSMSLSIRGDLDGNGVSNAVCWDEGDRRLYEHDPGGSSDCANTGEDDDLFVAGGTPPERNDATMTASRSVTLVGESVTLRVTMW